MCFPFLLTPSGRVPMRSSMLVLFLFLSAQAVAATRGDLYTTTTAAQENTPSDNPDSIPVVDPKLFTKRHYLSPRVLFSSQPPDAEPSGSQSAGRRTRRQAGQPQHRGMYSVCESISVWVVNKTKATDTLGREVTVLPDVKINNVNMKQYFFETTCHSPRSGSSGCLGIDARHWNSYCTNSHTFVRALTSFQNLVAWRHIRINVACVCVLSRKSWRQWRLTTRAHRFTNPNALHTQTSKQAGRSDFFFHIIYHQKLLNLCTK